MSLVVIFLFSFSLLEHLGYFFGSNTRACLSSFFYFCEWSVHRVYHSRTVDRITSLSEIYLDLLHTFILQ